MYIYMILRGNEKKMGDFEKRLCKYLLNKCVLYCYRNLSSLLTSAHLFIFNFYI